MIKKIIMIALIVLLAFGGVVVVSKITNTKTKRIYPAFSSGDVSDSGQYVKSDEAVCTKNYIECQGLSITPSFDNKSEYKIFWYDEDESYKGCTEKFGAQKTFKPEDVPENARYCRIALYPEMSGDGEDSNTLLPDILDIELSGINQIEAMKYASKFTIKVNKVQKYEKEVSN